MFGFENRKSLPKRGIKKMDAVVTGLILGGIVASIYGIKKTEEYRKDKAVQEHAPEVHSEDAKLSVGSILKMLVLGVEAVEKPEKPTTLWGKFLSFFR